MTAAWRPGWFSTLGIGPDSRILLFGSEGATDPDIFEAIVGRPAEAVERIG